MDKINTIMTALRVMDGTEKVSSSFHGMKDIMEREGPDQLYVKVQDFSVLSLFEKHTLLDACISDTTPKPLMFFVLLTDYCSHETIPNDMRVKMLEALIDRAEEAKLVPSTVCFLDYSDYANYFIRRNNTLASRIVSTWIEDCSPDRIYPVKPEENKNAIAAVFDGYMDHGCDSDIFMMLDRGKEPVLDCCWDLLNAYTKKTLAWSLEKFEDEQTLSILKKNPKTKASLSRSLLLDRIDNLPPDEKSPKNTKKKM